MIYYLFAGICLLAALYFFTPVQHRIDAHRVHAARAKPLGPFVRARRRYPLAGFVVDNNGVSMNLRDRFVGLIEGNSCAKFGLTNGAEFVAEYLDFEKKKNLKHNDVVVVDAVAKHHKTLEDLETGRRLRIVDRIDNGTNIVTFRKDGHGLPRRERPIEDIEALVTHIRSN